MNDIKNKIQSDISQGETSHPSTIEEVGLTDVQMPVRVLWNKEEEQALARISVVVSIDKPRIRGIHMSRLYLELHHFLEKETVTLSSLVKLLDQCIQTQEGVSTGGRIKLSWQGSVKRPSLKSKNEGWHVYPCYLEVEKAAGEGSQTICSMGTSILYSSTCPCSAALSRELIQKKLLETPGDINKETMLKWLGEESSHVATPHSQKSEARVRVTLDQKETFSLIDLINSVERSLSTSVQVAVKREDEQEFARLNANNLMYTEDAIRRIKAELESKSMLQDYHIKVRHIESLHPFDTLAQSRKVKI